MKGYLDKYPAYAEQLKNLETHCSLAVDLRGLFDNIKEPIFYDPMHTGSRGNQIIAEKNVRTLFTNSHGKRRKQ